MYTKDAFDTMSWVEAINKACKVELVSNPYVSF